MSDKGAPAATVAGGDALTTNFAGATVVTVSTVDCDAKPFTLGTSSR